MNKIESLINKLCPNGVEFRNLGEIGIRNKGINITAQQMKKLHKDNAPVCIFAAGNTIVNVNFEDLPSKNIINRPSIMVKSRGYIDFEFCEKPFTHKNELWSYTIEKSEISQKFVFYFLKKEMV